MVIAGHSKDGAPSSPMEEVCGLLGALAGIREVSGGSLLNWSWETEVGETDQAFGTVTIILPYGGVEHQRGYSDLLPGLPLLWQREKYRPNQAASAMWW